MIEQFKIELERATKLHPAFPKDIVHMVSIMMEEGGESTKAANQYHSEGGSIDEVIREVIHTGAMCLRILNAINNKDYNGPENS